MLLGYARASGRWERVRLRQITCRTRNDRQTDSCCSPSTEIDLSPITTPPMGPAHHGSLSDSCHKRMGVYVRWKSKHGHSSERIQYTVIQEVSIPIRNRIHAECSARADDAGKSLLHSQRQPQLKSSLRSGLMLQDLYPTDCKRPRGPNWRQVSRMRSLLLGVDLPRAQT